MAGGTSSVKNILALTFAGLIALAVVGRGESMGHDLKTAIFAGGCFWCMEYEFEKVPGVVEAISGYTGGETKDPTYQEVCTGKTGHYEAVLVKYDPTRVSYERLLEVFWKHIDPTDPGGQFFDRGSQYRTAIFYRDEEQKALALESKRRIEAAGLFSRPIVTEILPAKEFYPAEDYHQDYYRVNRSRFALYHSSSGRERFLDSVWRKARRFRLFPERRRYWLGYQKPTPEGLRRLLTPLQYRVTQEGATEPPFANPYWDNHDEGIYVDVVSGEPLFSSRDKFDSGTGWPSFTRPLDGFFIVEREDHSLGLSRVEVRSRFADSHLGHVFNDGPPPTGLRYCINSAALYFIPREDLARYGYGFYEGHF